MEPYFMHAIEVWEHSVLSENNILVKLGSKALRILFNCHRTADAWKHTDNKINNIYQFYCNEIKSCV